jgi:hypothetical protein
MEQIMEILARMETKMETNRGRDRDDLKGIMAEMNVKMDGKQEQMLARMREEIKSGQAEMRSTICAVGSELKDTIQRVMRATIQPVRSEIDETTACNKARETKPDPGRMQPTEKHHEIPKGEAAVMPVGEPRKRCRVRNLAAERRQKRKERTRGKSGFRKKLAAVCRKVCRHAKVAWRKRKLVRRFGTQENCGPRK